MKRDNILIFAVICSIFSVNFLSNISCVTAQSPRGGNICYSWYSIDPNTDRLIESEVTNENPVQEWEFVAEAGMFVFIRMEVTAGNLDPFLEVFDQTTGDRIYFSSSNTSDGRRIITVPNLGLSSDGNYLIRATRLGELSGTTTGDYKLILEPSFENILDNIGSGTLQLTSRRNASIYDGETITGQNLSSGQFDAWHFNGQQGQQVTVVLGGLQTTPLLVNGIVINLDQSTTRSWNEIDAVELRGFSEGEEIRQWASRAVGSSEYGNPSWGAIQATGSPNTDQCGDRNTAWASRGNNGIETLTLFFDQPVIPSQIDIYQTYNPGAITGVELIPLDSDETVPIENSADPGTDCPGIFSLQVSYPVLSLVAYVEGKWETVKEVADIISKGEERISNFTLPYSGQYSIIVSASQQTLQTYSLTAVGTDSSRPGLPRCSQVIPQCPTISPLGTAANPIGNDMPLTGSITASVPIIAYQFQAFTGDSVTINLQRTSGDLNTFLALADSDGNILARDSGDSSNASLIDQFRLPSDGCYFIYAARDGGNDGTTQGTFTITATGLPAIRDQIARPPTNIEFGGDISVGESILGTIDDEIWRVAYRIRTEDSSELSAVVTRISGNLQPSLALLDADGNELITVSASLFGDSSNPLNFVTEPNEYYFIVVQRESGLNGNTSGDFSLTVTR